MAVGFSNTNKPLNPRGQDASPKGYNRASLFSGKALDFDGVNDDVSVADSDDLDGFTNFSIQAIINADGFADFPRILDKDFSTAYNWGVYTGDNNKLYCYINNNLFKFDYITETNKWIHLVLAFTGGSKIELFVNGQLEETKTHSIASVGTNSNALIIGQNHTQNYARWNGEISNVKIFNTALTAAQVADLYNNPEKVVPTGVDNTALKLRLPMMEGAGTTAINGAPDALGSEIIINGDFSDGSSNWNPNPRVTISGGKATYDDAGTGNFNQTISGGFDTSTDYILTFDISDASTYANLWLGNASGSNSYTNGGSYESYENGHNAVFLKGSNIDASDVTLGFWISTGGSSFSIDNISLKEVANCGTISGATWTHGIGAPVSQTSIIDWNKWKLEGGSTSNEYLIPQGLTSGRDLLGNLFENVRKQGALNLDGNSWAEVHDNASLDVVLPCTLEAWVNNKSGELSTNNRYMAIFDKAPNSNGGGGFSLRLYSNISANGGYIALGGSFSTFNFTDGSYQHIVVTLEANSQKVYINGALQNSFTNAWTIQVNSETLKIGYAPSDGQQWLNGSVAQPRIYNRALTASEVLQNYNSGKNTYK